MIVTKEEARKLWCPMVKIGMKRILELKQAKRLERQEIMNNERIKLEDSPMTAIVKLVEGNPGAIHVCAEFAKKTKGIDPDNVLGGMGNIFSLDINGIYGSRIWMLYNDVCKQDIVKAIGLLRANQLGYMTRSELDHAIDNYGEGVDIEILLDKVKKRLPNFNLELETVDRKD